MVTSGPQRSAGLLLLYVGPGLLEGRQDCAVTSGARAQLSHCRITCRGASSPIGESKVGFMGKGQANVCAFCCWFHILSFLFF